jgi:hypothetical protein
VRTYVAGWLEASSPSSGFTSAWLCLTSPSHVRNSRIGTTLGGCRSRVTGDLKARWRSCAVRAARADLRLGKMAFGICHVRSGADFGPRMTTGFFKRAVMT